MVLDRVLALSDVYLHHVCDPTRSYGASRFTGGSDTVIRSEDGGATFTIDDEYRLRVIIIMIRTLT